MFKMCIYVFESLYMHVHAAAEYPTVCASTYDCCVESAVWEDQCVPIDVVLSSVRKVNGRGR